jgi:phosphatidylglycerophosphatase A
MKTVIKMLSTFFYLGYTPLIPGTIGSLGGLLFYLMVKHSATLYIGSLIVLIILALLVINKAEKHFGKIDAGPIVIDEAAGMMIAFLFIPQEPVLIVFAFIAFMLFDIVKPFPIKWAEGIRSPWGVLLDDVIAGIYTNLVTQAFFILAIKRGV